jgi:putative sterol carrier protein
MIGVVHALALCYDKNMSDIQKVFEEMHKHFKPEAAQGLDASFLFNITGANGGKYAFKIKDGKCDFMQQGIENPSVEIAMSDTDWKAIREGKLNSQMAFMQGKLKIKGDMGLAMKLQNVFPLKAAS